MGSHLTLQVAMQPRARNTARFTPVRWAVPPVIHEVLRASGQALDPETRGFMEPRFGQDFSRVPAHALQTVPYGSYVGDQSGTSAEREADRVADRVVRMDEPGSPGPASSGYDFGRVRVHTGAKAAESARAINARAYTAGREIVFGAGQYAPQTQAGRRLLAHELAHVAQQSASPNALIQAFTAEQGEEGRVFLRPERGDTDADLDRVLCPAISGRRIAGRARIDITDCLPRGTIKAMTLGPYNCAQFVRFALAGGAKPAGTAKASELLTGALWKDLLNSGYRVASFAVLDKNGKVEMAAPESLSWKQIDPTMGSLVFMRGDIKLTAGDQPNPEGDNFSVSWDHVGFFLVRSRKGFDYHLAKDGDENPIGVYHTGMALAPEEGLGPGAYVKGAGSLVAYLRLASVGMGDVKLREARDEGGQRRR